MVRADRRTGSALACGNFCSLRPMAAHSVSRRGRLEPFRSPRSTATGSGGLRLPPPHRVRRVRQSRRYYVTNNALSFTEFSGNKIGRIHPRRRHRVRYPHGRRVRAPDTAGPDGNLWFTETSANKIGRITPAGVSARFPFPPQRRTVRHHGRPGRPPLVHRSIGDKIGRITPAGASRSPPSPSTPPC